MNPAESADGFCLYQLRIVLRIHLFRVAERMEQALGEEAFELREGILKSLESTKWYLWHGNVFQALEEIESIEADLETTALESSDEVSGKLLKTVEEFHTYIQNNEVFIPNYGERFRQGETISTAFVESTVNQLVSKRMVKKQQMQGSERGAHLLLQVRTRVLDDELEDVFRDWYPGFRPPNPSQIQPLEARPPHSFVLSDIGLDSAYMPMSQATTRNNA